MYKTERKYRLLIDRKINTFFEVDNYKKEYSKKYKKELDQNYPFSLNEISWYEYKEKFKQQRFDEYNKGLTDKEISIKEIEYINVLLKNMDNGHLNFKEKDTFKTLAKRYIDYLTISQTKQQKKTYQWQSNPDKEIPELYSLMINQYKLIASDTKPEQFKAIFTGQPIDSVKPIKWLAKKNLLAYFIDHPIFINKLPLNTDYWAKAKYCFQGANSLVQSKNNYLNNKTLNGKPTNYIIIDELLNSFTIL